MTPPRSRSLGNIRFLAATVVLVAGLCTLATAPALADHGTGCCEPCPGADAFACEWDGEGHVISNSNFDSPTTGFGGFIVIALLWSLAPAGIAAGMASSRGESVGLAVVIALIFGWLGLAGLYFYWKDVPSRNMPALVTFPPQRPPARPEPRTDAGRSAGGKETADRLRELKSLLDQGLIERSEYDSRRQAILNDL